MIAGLIGPWLERASSSDRVTSGPSTIWIAVSPIQKAASGGRATFGALPISAMFELASKPSAPWLNGLDYEVVVLDVFDVCDPSAPGDVIDVLEEFERESPRQVGFARQRNREFLAFVQ